MTIFASAYGSISLASDAGIVIPGTISQAMSGDTALPGVDTGSPLTFQPGSWDAMASRLRWARVRVEVEGQDLGEDRTASVQMDSELDAGRQRTMSFHVSNTGWSLPAAFLWGNKQAEAFVSLADNPRTPTEWRVFSGYTFQKEDDGDTPAEVNVTCVDRSLAIAGVPVCYSNAAFSGKTRGQIVREIALSLGFTDGQIRVPVGQVVNKPVQLNNASLLSWIAEFGRCENWFPYIDDDGNLVVEIISLKTTPDWIFDAAKGDFDLESFKETPPSRPPCRIYITASQPIATTGPDGLPVTVTTVQTDEVVGLYNPLCIKSAGTLQSDGTYRFLQAQELMVTNRIITETTKQGADEILKVVKTFAFYNPAAVDPNYNTSPATTDYDNAYADHSFHRDAVESLMETRRDTTTTIFEDVRTVTVVIEGLTTREIYGEPLRTVTGVVTETLAWIAPKAFLNYNDVDRLVGPTSAGGSYVYSPGPSGRSIAVEEFQLFGRVETTYEYGEDGAIERQVDNAYSWTSPQAVCDIVQTATPGVSSVAAPGAYASPDVCVRNNWKYSDQDWRLDQFETFQLSETIQSDFLVVDGQVLQTIERRSTFGNPLAGIPGDAIIGPPYLFADKTFRWLPVDTFQQIAVKFNRYETFSEYAYQVTMDDFDLITGQKKQTILHVDGPQPLAPTIGGSSQITLQALVAQIAVDPCEFQPSKMKLELPWAETNEDMDSAGLREMQRQTAVVRQLTCAYNPLMKVGDTLRLTDLARGIEDTDHLVTAIKLKAEVGADMDLVLEWWPVTL